MSPLFTSDNEIYTLDVCWVGVIFFACVCGGTSNLTTASDDPITCCSLSACASGAFLGGSQGKQDCPHWLRRAFGFEATPRFFFGGDNFFYFSVFAIFSGFLN
jgi:hypothetical protein